jgi:glycerol-3-phosphate cytidylyltransferase
MQAMIAFSGEAVQRPKKVIGYLTMTGDLVHDGHFRLLAASRERCDYLCVGLVTDELGIRQKRRPLLCYEHRRSILENCKYVDFVVPHSGEPKAVAWEKLKFDILFSSDEYFESKEFKDFAIAKPDIPVVYIPRPKPDPISSSVVIQDLMLRLQESQTIVTVGITGYITRQGFGPWYISKPIHFGNEECTSDSTRDVYGFYKNFDELPRNWKSEHHYTVDQVPQFPMIAGINSHREVQINMRLKQKPWCTFIDAITVFSQAPSKPITESKNYETLLAFANDVARARQFPTRIVNLLQRDGGITFEIWAQKVCKSQNAFDAIVVKIENIIHELEDDGIVHGDIHPRNILIDEKTEQVSIIDFGWVSARCFQMCSKEEAKLERALQDQFDRTHFHKSMRVCPDTNKWLLLDT